LTNIEPEYHYAECCHAECHYAENHYAMIYGECHYAKFVMLSDIMLNVIMLSVMTLKITHPFFQLDWSYAHIIFQAGFAGQLVLNEDNTVWLNKLSLIMSSAK
jgi:hypothetical protein